jgi:hypothetical protein
MVGGLNDVVHPLGGFVVNYAWILRFEVLPAGHGREFWQSVSQK